MKRNAYRPLSAMILAILVTTGCARDLTVGDRITGESADLAEIGATWTEGDELVAEGREEIEEGREMIAEGREKIAEGEDKVSDGKALKQQAQRAYRARTGRPLPEF